MEEAGASFLFVQVKENQAGLEVLQPTFLDSPISLLCEMPETQIWDEGTPKLAINGCFVKKAHRSR